MPAHLPQPTDHPPAEAAPRREAAAFAVELLAALLEAGSAAAAARVLLRELAARAGCEHAGLARVEHGDCIAWQSWQAAGALDEKRFLAAADEALDQGLALAWPAQPARPGIVLALRTLAESAGPAAWAVSLPLSADGRPVASLCLLRRDRGGQTPEQSAAALAELEHLCALAAPLLALQLERERGALARLRLQARAWAQGLRGPQGGRRRGVLGLAAAALLLASLVPVDQRVGGQARVEGAEQRVLAAPVDGFLKAAHVHPGEHVRAGQLLADLAEQDLQLEREKWSSQLAQHENAYAAAMARSDRGEAAVALAKVSEAEAQLALVRGQLQRAQLTAPFDGIVVDGDLGQRIGAPVRQGDALLTVAAATRFRVIVQIDERDIAGVRAGQRGVLALSALPWDTLDIRVLRVTPLAKAEESGNVFEVQAELLAGAKRLAEVRPGLQGQAKLVVGRAPWLWGVLQPIARRVRVAAWSWMG